MGIPAYFSYIVKNYHKLLLKLSNSNLNTHNFYMDCNSIIYDCVTELDKNLPNDVSIDNIISNVCKKIDLYINIIKPSNNIYIAFDGVAPIAKLEQQRNRRFKSQYLNAMYKQINENNMPDAWNTSAITPGTEFMSKLNSALKKKYKFPKMFNVKNLILSTSENPGEGEHKIFQYIRDNPYEHNVHNTVIYGLDADLIMLCITHIPYCLNINLFRETPHFIKSISSELDANENYIIDIKKLADLILIEMTNENESVIVNNSNRILDYIFICFFLGNDFLPHFPALNIRTGGIEKMLQAYKNTIGVTNETIIQNKQINWLNLKKLIRFLADNEYNYLVSETKLRNKQESINNKKTPSTFDEKWDYFQSMPIRNRSTEKYINVFKTNWQRRYYSSLFELEIDDKRRKQISINFLQGLEWTFNYYIEGCVDWSWKYNYHYPPLLNDLINFIPHFKTSFLDKTNTNVPIPPLLQLSYVLPKCSLNLLPTNIRAKLLDKYEHLYPDDTEFVWSYCKYFWESHAKLPEIDLIKINGLINS